MRLAPPSRPRAGFTLVEMATVVALLVLMTALGVASLDPMRARMALRQGGERTQQTLLLARERAMALGRCVRVEAVDSRGLLVPWGFAAAGLRLRPWSLPSCTEPATLEPGETFLLPTNVRVTAPEENLDILPSGRPLGGERSLLLSDTRGGSLQVRLAALGTVCLGGGACP